MTIGTIRTIPPKADRVLWNELVEYGLVNSGTSFPGSPKTNQIFYRTDTNNLYYYSGAIWIKVSSLNFDDFSGIGSSITSEYITGSILLSGSTIYSPVATLTNINAVTVTGSSIISGSNIYGALAKITNINATNITGSNISGSSFSGPLSTITNINATNITGSSIISGSNIYGSIGKITNISGSQLSLSGNLYVDGTIIGDIVLENVNVEYITGSVQISGSNYIGNNLTVTNITGSTISGSNFFGNSASITNINVTNITGSVISGSNIYSPNAKITNIVSTNITGSNVSGSNVYGSTGIITNISGSQASFSGNLYVNGDISGSMITDNITALNVTGSNSISGSNVYGNVGKITTLSVTNITGSNISGSNIYGTSANITNITGSNISGSNIYGSYAKITNVTGSNISGSNIYGSFAKITNITGSNISGSTIYGSYARINSITGSIFSGSNVYVASGSITNLISENITGSKSVSGSAIYGASGSISNLNVTNLTGSGIISGSRIISSFGLNRPCNYIIYSGSGMYWAENGRTGKVEYSGSSATYVIQNSVNSLPTDVGGKLFFGPGKFLLTGSIFIDKNSVEIAGTNTTGDLYFSGYASYEGLYNKWATSFIAVDIDAFNVGSNVFCQGTSFKDFGINGTLSDVSLDDTIYSNGTGIKISKGNTIHIENIQIQRKEYGIYLHTGSYTLGDVVDAVFLRNLLFVYNVYGIYTGDWTANVRAENIYGYINQRSLFKITQARYDWRLNNIFSNADSYNASAITDAPISIVTQRDVHINGLYIAGGSGVSLCPTPLMYIELNRYVDGTEGHRGYVYINDVVLTETDEQGIYLTGSYGMLNVKNIYAGSTGWLSWHGGYGSITKSIITNQGSPETEFYVDYGYASSLLATKSQWFSGSLRVENVANYPMKNGGTVTYSGDGVTDNKIIPHGLVKTPTTWGATPSSLDAYSADIARIYVDATNVTICFVNPPANGTNNVTLCWWAEVDKT